MKKALCIALFSLAGISSQVNADTPPCDTPLFSGKSSRGSQVELCLLDSGEFRYRQLRGSENAVPVTFDLSPIEVTFNERHEQDVIQDEYTLYHNDLRYVLRYYVDDEQREYATVLTYTPDDLIVDYINIDTDTLTMVALEVAATTQGES